MRDQSGRRCAHLNAAGAAQIGHFFDPVTADVFPKTKPLQFLRQAGIRVPGQEHMAHNSPVQGFFQLFRSDKKPMVTEVSQAAGTQKTPFNKSIHTNPYYTLFREKVNKFFTQKYAGYPAFLPGFPVQKHIILRQFVHFSDGLYIFVFYQNLRFDFRPLLW